MSRKPVWLGSILLLAIVLSLGGSPAYAQVEREEVITRVSLPNDVGIEMLGRGLLYSFYYQRMLNKTVAVDFGLSALGSSDEDDSSSLIFVPFGGKIYLIPKNGSIFLAGGGVYLSASTDSGPFDAITDATYAYVGLGMELRQPGGFLFRGQVYNLIADGNTFIWPGLSVGFAF